MAGSGDKALGTRLTYVQLLSNFREQVRNIAKQEKVGKILKLYDDLRDEALPNLGVKLEDQEGKCIIYKIDQQ